MLKTAVSKCIYQSPNGIMVLQNPLYRWLTFNSGAIQTLILRKNPKKPGLEYILYLMYAAKLLTGDCCILGLGGAGVVHALAPFMNQHRLTAVECNAEVIEVAKQYFMLNDIANLKVVCSEASIFVGQTQQKYTHLLVDLYNAYAFPIECASTEFFMNCKRRLHPNGVISINLANHHQQLSIFKLIQDCFQVYTIAIPVNNTANLIIMACHQDNFKQLLELIKQDKKLKNLEWDSLWGYVARF